MEVATPSGIPTGAANIAVPVAAERPGTTTSARRGFAWWSATRDGWLETHPRMRWQTGWTQAECDLLPRFLRGRWRRLHPEGVPGAFCPCGIRGLYATEPAWVAPGGVPVTRSGADGLVFGAVEGDGPFAIDERGWRTRFGRPLALFVPTQQLLADDGRVGSVAARYNIPILRDLDVLKQVWGPGSEPTVDRGRGLNW
jgi:hypothetical protein